MLRKVCEKWRNTRERGAAVCWWGQYDYAIDAKGRLNFPARFREMMGQTFIVTRWLDSLPGGVPGRGI